MRRLAYEQRSQAVQMINAYAEAMSAGKGNARGNTGASQQVPADDLFAMMGATVKS